MAEDKWQWLNGTGLRAKAKQQWLKGKDEQQWIIRAETKWQPEPTSMSLTLLDWWFILPLEAGEGVRLHPDPEVRGGHVHRHLQAVASSGGKGARPAAL